MSTSNRGHRTRDWLDENEEAAWRAFRRAAIAVQSGTAADLAGTGLSDPDYEVLSTLVDMPDQTSPLHRQAAKMGWSRSRLSRHTARMQARGLISRSDDPDDGRGCLLSLTPDGRAALRAATPTHLASVRHRFADRLDGRDLADLRRIADKLGRPAP